MSDVVDLTILSLRAKLTVEANRLRAALVAACESQARIDELSADLAGLLQVAEQPRAASICGQPQTYATLP